MNVIQQLEQEEILRLTTARAVPEFRAGDTVRVNVRIREAGYREITLWTHSVLTAARRIYAEAGFQLVATEPHNRFGPMVVGETWTLKL